MKFKRIISLLVACGLLIAVAFFLGSCATSNLEALAPPEIPGANYVGNQACYDCHTNITRSFAASPHARIYSPTAAMRGQSGCESCHGPGSKHIQAGGGRGVFIVNPGRNPAACFQCHLDAEAEFHLSQHHPVLEGKMNCVQCHDPHGMDIYKHSSGLAMARLNEGCAQCHHEQTRPFVFEHEAMREGCTVCHAPHGSVNRKLLVEPDANLCLRCHAQNQAAPPTVQAGSVFIGKVDHTAFLRQGTCWSAGCHTAVHGSDVHPRMLY